MPDNCSDKIIAFSIPESPSRQGSHRLTIKEWMEKLRNASKKIMAESHRPIDYPVKVVCHIRLDQSAAKYDLDNLVKCLIDALGAAKLFNPSSTGGHRTPWNTDDWWVHIIQAEKEIVDNGHETKVEVWRK